MTVTNSLEEKCYTLKDHLENVHRVKAELDTAINGYVAARAQLLNELGDKGLTLNITQVWAFAEIFLSAVGNSVPPALRIEPKDLSSMVNEEISGL